MTDFVKVRRQISGDPCSRQPKASAAQLDYIASMIVECEGIPGFRWDYTNPETFTVRRASQMIDSLNKTMHAGKAHRFAREVTERHRLGSDGISETFARFQHHWSKALGQ